MAATTRPPAEPQWSLPRGLIVLLSFAGAVVTVAGLRSSADILGPVFLALMLAIAVSPLQGWAGRRGIPRWLAVVVSLVGVYLIILLLAVALAVSVARLATLLPTYQDAFTELVDRVQAALADLGVGHPQIRAVLDRLDVGATFGVLQGFLTGLVGVFSDLLFILVLLFFMVIDAAGIPDRAQAASTTRPHIMSALSAFIRGTQRYLIVSTIFGLIVAVIDVGALYLLGIPLPVLWGLLAFITNYIPNIGFVIGVIPPALLGLLEGGPRLLILVIVAYTVINFLIQSLIQPRFVGEAVGLSVTLTFLSLVFWTWVIGPLGALLAIPLTLLAKALLVDIDPSAGWLSYLISTKAVPPPSGGQPAHHEREETGDADDGQVP